MVCGNKTLFFAVCSFSLLKMTISCCENGKKGVSFYSLSLIKKALQLHNHLHLNRKLGFHSANVAMSLSSSVIVELDRSVFDAREERPFSFFQDWEKQKTIDKALLPFVVSHH